LSLAEACVTTAAAPNLTTTIYVRDCTGNRRGIKGRCVVLTNGDSIVAAKARKGDSNADAACGRGDPNSANPVESTIPGRLAPMIMSKEHNGERAHL
jgi:hypothetical protein